VVEELRTALPSVIGELPLTQMWAYLYDPEAPTGIHAHADAAQVNLNLWISEMAAHEAGADQAGMMIFLKEPPPGWDFLRFNVQQSEDVRDYCLILLSQNHALAHVWVRWLHRQTSALMANSQNVTIAYKQNRMVMFKSSLIHRTSKKGPEKWFGGLRGNRRINLTFLFGERVLQ
jgi:hypothetical protein